MISAPSEALKYGGRRGDNKRLHDDVRGYPESQTEDTELQLMVPGFVAELRVSPSAGYLTKDSGEAAAEASKGHYGKLYHGHSQYCV